MEQYQQWMHYREVDRLLHEQLERIEDELARLLQSSPEESHSPCPSNNPIVLALAASLNEESQDDPLIETVSPLHDPAQAQQYFSPSMSDIAASEEQIAPAAAISPALRSWGEFPGTQESVAPELAVPFWDQTLPPVPHSSFDMLPDDMNALFEQHTPTDPQIELPWWLQNIASTAGVNQSNGLMDLQSVRTNRLVQRWLERWGRQPPSQKQGE